MGEQSPKEKINIWLPFFFSFVMVGGIIIGLRMQDSASVFEIIKQDQITTNSSMESPILQTIRFVDAKYVDSLNKTDITDGIIRDIVSELDPHSIYIPKNELSRSKEQLNGSFEGIGIDFMVFHDTVVVGHVIGDSPAEKAGLRTGDMMLKVNDLRLSGRTDINTDTVIAILKGIKGTTVNVSGYRVDYQPFETSIERDIIKVPSIPAFFMLDDRIGYIRINSFTSTTSTEFAQAAKAMADDSGMRHLILDLRDNPGGYLGEAVEVLNHIFKEKNRLLVYTEGAKVGKEDYETNGASQLNIDKVAILVNENSASASEIAAGAIQDWDRGMIIGRRTFGKGLVQEEFPLLNGGAIRITVARYYTPSGRCIQKNYSDIADYGHEVSNRYASGEVFSKDSNTPEDTTQYFTAKGRVVYGGGGIRPEFFIALDSIELDTEYIQLSHKVYPFLIKTDRGQLGINGLEGSQYVADYVPPADLVDAFYQFAERDSVTLTNRLKDKFRPSVQKLLKLHIGKIFFDDKAYYQSQIQNGDLFIQKAVEEITKSTRQALSE